MEGIGIWIFLALFYLLQALAKRKQKQQRQQQPKAPRPKPMPRQAQRPAGGLPRSGEPPKQQKPVSLEDLFNPDRLRDILGVPQPEPGERPKPISHHEPVRQKSKTRGERWQEEVKSKQFSGRGQDVRKNWSDTQTNEEYYEPEVRETASKVASADITDVDETAIEFKTNRLGRSDITSERFDKRKVAPGKKKPKVALASYFDEPEDIRNAIILKEILDRPRAFRRNIR